MATDDRHSQVAEANLVTHPDEVARQEAHNGLRQFDRAIEQIEYWAQPERKPYRLRPSHITNLNRIALVADLIAANEAPYYEALEKADETYKATEMIDVSAMETLLSSLLARQLTSVFHAAQTNGHHGEPSSPTKT